MPPKLLNYVSQKPRPRTPWYYWIPLILLVLLVLGATLWLYRAWNDPRNWN